MGDCDYYGDICEYFVQDNWRCKEISMINVKTDAICEKCTLNVKQLGSLNAYNISHLELFGHI